MGNHEAIVDLHLSNDARLKQQSLDGLGLPALGPSGGVSLAGQR
jgi:hypothetical protein